LRGVRNLAPTVLEPAPRFNVFFGDNGQGKTNLLETIYVVGALRSFRTQRMAEIIALGHDQAYIGARVERDGLERVYELTQKHRGRHVRLDGKAVRPIAKYFGDFNVVLFAPEDLQIPRGSPVSRRRFLDRAVFNRRPHYLGQVQSYEKTVRNRNALLRDIASGKRPKSHTHEVLSVFDQQLAVLGSSLISARISFINEIRSLFQRAFESITQTGIPVDLHYCTVDDVHPESDIATIRDRLTAQINIHRSRDLVRGTTSVGPHRDDLRFEFAGQPAGSFASQGQLRALVLSWKTAEMELLATVHGEEPVLLLDDVSSELDPTRNKYLFEFLRRRRNQCFITTTHPRYVLLSDDRVDYRIERGTVAQQNQ